MIIEPSDQDIKQVYDRIKESIYDLQPDFQRDLVWNLEKQQKLIDSIMRGWHIPPIHLVKIENKEMYEVLDGKQRLYSVYNFLNDKFTFNGQFIPGKTEFKELHGKKFSEFSDETKRKFRFTKIRIFEVSDVSQNEATELFLRLNLGVSVTAPEKRNCIYGQLKQFLRKEIVLEFGSLFNPEVLGFENHRMAYQDILDKLFFLELRNSLNYKPSSKALEEMYFEKEIFQDPQINLKNNLKLLEKVLPKLNKRLTKSIIMSYYWFLRELSLDSNFNESRVIDFLIKFEEWRNMQISNYDEKKQIHSKFVAFENYLSVGWLDPVSLKGRHKILIDFYNEYNNTNKFGDV